MSGNNPLDAIFKKDSNYTKEEFFAKFQEMKISEQDNEDSSTIFKLESETVEALFDTLDKKKDGLIDNDDIQTLKNLDTTDGENTLSEKDIVKLYEQTLQSLTQDNKSAAAEEMYENSVLKGNLKPDIKGDNSASAYLSNLSSLMTTIEDLIEARQKASESKIERAKAELDSLIIRESNLLKEEKEEYLKNKTEIEQNQKQIKERNEKLKEKRKELNAVKNEIKYLEVFSKKNREDKTANIKEWQDKFADLQKECSSIQSEIDKYTNRIEKITEKQAAFTNKAKSIHANFENTKQKLSDEIVSEKNICESEITQYNTQLKTLNNAYDYAIDQSAADCIIEEYSDEDTTSFSGDAKDLKSIWSKKYPHLSDGFYNKVVEISKRVGCDANALMAVMKSESGLKTTAVNKSSKATGLIQFIPSTAQRLGTSTEALKRMSAEQQLVYVEKYLLKNKKMAGFKENETLQQGQLYALVFLPAYAKRQVLTVKGHKYYNSNKGLDMDKDGQITLSDLNRRVEQMKIKG